MRFQDNINDEEYTIKPTDATFLQFALEARRENLEAILRNFSRIEERWFYIPSTTSTADKIKTIEDSIRELRKVKSSRTKGIAHIDGGFYLRGYPESYKKEYLASMRGSEATEIQRNIDRLESEIRSYQSASKNSDTINRATYAEINQRIYNTWSNSSKI